MESSETMVGDKTMRVIRNIFDESSFLDVIR